MAAEAEREQLESELAGLRARVHQGIIECAEQEQRARELREQVRAMSERDSDTGEGQSYSNNLCLPTPGKL